MSDFHFDFLAVEGMDYETGLMTLLRQFEDHYNTNFKSKLTFGAVGSRADKGHSDAPTVSTDDRKPTNQVAPVPVTPTKPAGPVDTETVTPKTMNMKSFAIKDGKELGLKEGDTILKGITDKGTEVFDKLLPGYDQQPYGPVVAGESGRYNLNWKAK